MGSDEARGGSVAADWGQEGRLVDINTGVVRRDHVLVQSTPAAVLCIGFGPRAARLQRFAFAEDGDPPPFLVECARIAKAIEAGDLAKARQFGAPDSLAEIDNRNLRRLAIAEVLMGAGHGPRPAAPRPSSLRKADPEDPKHPGWPAGTAGGLGGKFRPKEAAPPVAGDRQPSAKPKVRALVAEEVARRGARIAARRVIRQGALAVLRLAVEGVASFVPGLGVIADIAAVADLAALAADFARLKTDTDAAVDFVKGGPRSLEELQASQDSESFSSFDAFKKGLSIEEELAKRFGPAGDGYDYHHIVEQGGANGSDIPQGQLQSTDNIVRIPRLLHEAINAVYGSPAPDAPKLTLREWLRTQPFEVQRAMGIQIMRELGIVK